MSHSDGVTGLRGMTHSLSRTSARVMRLCVVVVSVLGLSAMTQPSGRAPDWSDAAVESLIFAVSEAWTHGLDPEDYVTASRLRALPDGEERNVLATDLFLSYGADLAFGKVDPRLIDEDWTAPVEDQDLSIWLRSATRSGEVYEALEALAPQHPDYQALREELIYRTTLSEQPITVPEGELIRKGDTGARVDALRARLHQMGYLERLDPPGTEFDGLLETAVLRFQARHNLAADGIVSAQTLFELNAPTDWRLAQLRANLERWRWLTHDLGARHIRVNLADYRLEAWEDGQLQRTHTTQIGRGYTRTPVFSESMSFLELNPVWYAPYRLGRPWVRTFQSNPQHALDNGYRLVDNYTGRQIHHSQADWTNGSYRVIQYPGPNNAMGEVKFMFPNRHNVYIHDTPHRDNFFNTQRAASSGCVRVADPIDLAWWILEDEPGWTRQRLDRVVNTNEITRVPLNARIPVHILYFTAITDEFGEVRFVHDVYQRDTTLISALDGTLALTAPEEQSDEEEGELVDSDDGVIIDPEEEDANARGFEIIPASDLQR